MDQSSPIFFTLVNFLRSKAESTLIREIAHEGDRLTLQIGANADSVIGLHIVDRDRPLFQVSYAKLVVKRDGTRHVRDTISDKVTSDGVFWIIDQLAKYDAVFPEFID